MNRPLDEFLSALGGREPLPAISADPTFSVIVRTQGDRPGSLAEAMESLAGQTLPPLETLVMVHSAGDARDEGRAAGVDEQLRVSGRALPATWTAVAVEGGDRSRPLNAGLDAASGDYVTFLDDDDLAEPTWLEAFGRGAAALPGAVVRARCLTQEWATEGTGQPVRPAGPIERPFAERFDLLAHFSHNETPICSIAMPRTVLERERIRFDEELPVFEDWELLMRVAMLAGVTSIPDETSLYRRLDSANAFEAVDEATWHRTHAAVVERLDSSPILLPPGAAARLAAAHFEPDGSTAHERAAAALESSPWWRLTGGPRRLVTAIRARRNRIGR